jgi:hypothetical protein
VEHGISPLAAWEGFYVIVGSSAAALTGLQFVVITLGAEVQTIAAPTTRAFATPTIVHFCAVLFVSAIISAPWHSLFNPALALAACGLLGVAYGIAVIKHTRKQTQYAPVLEDWIWHVVLPLGAYTAMLVGAAVMPGAAESALFVIGAVAVLLLFIGIHNAWDSVIYIALNRGRAERDASEEEK